MAYVATMSPRFRAAFVSLTGSPQETHQTTGLTLMTPPLPNEAEAIHAKPSWRTLITLLVVSSSALFCVQFLGWGSRKPFYDLALLFGLTNLGLYVWIRTGSHWKSAFQVASVLTLVCAQALIYAAVRIDGFRGDGRVILTWRWAATPEQRWDNFAAQSAPEPRAADLERVGPFDSPAFRGADRTGCFACEHLDTDWKVHPPRLLWRHPVGSGWSSFAVVGKYAVTQEQRGEHESVVCYELEFGNEIWEHRDEARFEEITGGPGPRATPAIHDGRVYASGATGLVNCLQGADGSVIWQRRLSEFDPNASPPLFGYSGSPLVHQGKVIVAGGGAGSLLAFSADDGALVWQAPTRACGYSSPQLWRSEQGDQLLLLDGIGLHGHDFETGKVLWSVEWGDGSDEYVNVGQPVTLTDSQNASRFDALVSSGYGRGVALFAIEQGPGAVWKAQERWRSKSLESKFSCVVVHDQHAYGLDKGILTCVSLLDGKRCWKKGRYGYGQLIVLNDLLLIQAEDGRIVLVRADPNSATEIAELAALPDRTWNHPVVASSRLLVRNDREAACYELPKSGDP